MPANSVISFEGGSFSNGTLNGNGTIIQDNQFFSFIKSNMALEGNFILTQVIANWFDEPTDSDMFQKACDFAYAVVLANYTYYSHSSLTVTCLSKSYYMSKGIYIPVGVSFNGNKATFFPKNNWITSDFMFKININRDENTTWEKEYPGNICDEFCNVNYSNPDNLLCHFILGADSRSLHNIYAFRPAIFYKQVYQYIDNKHFENIIISGKNSSFTFNSSDPYTYNIQWYLGDACEINHISDDASIYIGGGANVSIRNAINTTVLVSESRNIILENFHNENGIIELQRSSVILRNAYFYAKEEGNIFITGQYATGSELNLENVFMGNLLNLPDFNTYYPITDNSAFKCSRIIAKNVYGLINNGLGGHNSGNTILLKYKNLISGKTHLINPNGETINAEHLVNRWMFFNSDNISAINWQNGTGSNSEYIKTLYIVDEQRKLKLRLSDVLAEEVYVQSQDSTKSYLATMYSFGQTIQQLTNLIVKIFVGASSGNYNRYYDFPVVMQNKEHFILTEDGIDGLKQKISGTFSTNYTPCTKYKSDGYTVMVWLTGAQTPTLGNWEIGDSVILSDGKEYKYNGTGWY